MSQKINLDTSLGDFVAQYPHSRELFNYFDLDYCCKGEQNVVVAAKEKNIDLGEFESLLKLVLERVPNTEKYKSWTNESLTNIVNHIEAVHHSLTWGILTTIDMLLNKLMQVHGEKHGDFLHPLQSLIINFKLELEEHMSQEENVVFPAIRKLEEASNSNSPMPEKELALVQESIKNLKSDHEKAGEILSQIKVMTKNFELPDYACASFVKFYADLETLQDDLHAHIHLENTVLFPKLMKLVS